MLSAYKFRMDESTPSMPPERPSAGTGAAVALLRFWWAVLIVTFVVNAPLLLLSMNELIPRGRADAEIMLAFVIAVFISPSVNAVLVVIALIVAAALKAKHGNAFHDYWLVAFWAPVLVALGHFLAVLTFGTAAAP